MDSRNRVRLGLPRDGDSEHHRLDDVLLVIPDARQKDGNVLVQGKVTLHQCPAIITQGRETQEAGSSSR